MIPPNTTSMKVHDQQYQTNSSEPLAHRADNSVKAEASSQEWLRLILKKVETTSTRAAALIGLAREI